MIKTIKEIADAKKLQYLAISNHFTISNVRARVQVWKLDDFRWCLMSRGGVCELHLWREGTGKPLVPSAMKGSSVWDYQQKAPSDDCREFISVEVLIPSIIFEIIVSKRVWGKSGPKPPTSHRLFRGLLFDPRLWTSRVKAGSVARPGDDGFDVRFCGDGLRAGNGYPPWRLRKWWKLQT